MATRSVKPRAKAAKKTTKRKTAKERQFDKDFEYICMEIERGVALRRACPVFMSLRKFYELMDASSEKRERYARACEARADKIFDDLLDIADDGSNDTYVDDNGMPRTDTEVIQRSKLRVDTRKWMLAKLAPKKYGDKLDIDAKVDAKIETVTIFKLPDNGR